MCGFIGDIIDDIVDIIDDVVDVIVDIVDDVIGWLVPMPDIPDFGALRPDQNAKGILVNKFSSNAHIPIIYGTRKVGGNVVFLRTSGEDNKYLYMAVVLGEGEISEVTALYINDKRPNLSGVMSDNVQRTVTSADQNFYDTDNSQSLITVEAHFGTDTQESSSLLQEVGGWTTVHKLSGLAYLAIRFEWNADKFGSIPNVQALVKGRKVYNPNLDGTVTGGSGSHRKDDSSTWAYSDNPILQLLDYLRNDRFGMGIANSYFDSNFADWQTATDVCDAQITPVGADLLPILFEHFGVGYRLDGESPTSVNTIDLMNSHTVVDTAKKAIDNVKDFVRGSRSYLNFSGGKYNILVETTGSALITLTEDNILGGITIVSKNKNSRYNRVIANFINPDKNYQSDSAQFPPVDETLVDTADQHATLLAEDGGILLEGRFDFSMLTNKFQAQEMAEIILRRSRSSLDVSLKADATALDLSIGDIVNITHATPAFSAKPFRVQGLAINADHSISLTLSEHQDSFYTFGTQDAIPEIADTVLPNPFIVQTPTVSAVDELRARNEEAIAVLLVNVTANDLFITDFEVQAKKSTDSVFINLGRGSSSQFELVNVEDNVIYDIRARSVTSVSRSSFVSIQHQVVGKTEPPEDVTNFQVNIIGTEAHLSWTPVADLDLSHYIIRHSPLTSGAIFSNATTLVNKVSRPANTVTVPALTGTYFVRSIDKIGLASLNATSNVTLIQNIKDLNLIATSTQHTGFTGAKSNVVDIGSALILDTTNQFDEVSGNFDDALGSFDGGAGSVVSSGTYDFDTYIDVGGIYTNRITATVLSERVDYVNQFDDASGNFDDRAGVFDGDTATYGDVNVELQIAKTNQDPASGSPTYTAFQKFNVGDYTGRGFKFRAVLLSEDVEATPKVTQLSVTVDMPERVYSEKDIASGTSTSGKAVTFNPAFKEISGVGISASNLASGDYYAITSKSATGFTIANQGFPAFRADLNSALQALASNNSGTSAPSTTFANMWWYDSSNNIMYIRNEDNDAWIQFAVLDQTTDTFKFNGLEVDGNLTIDGGTIKLDGNYPVGTSNVALGNNAGNSIVSGGNYNTVIGDEAGTGITTGDENSFFGNNAGYSLNTGTLNVAMGRNALYSDTKGNKSTAVGKGSLGSQNFTSSTDTHNTAVGYEAGKSVSSGIQNTLIGGLAGDALSDADSNVVVGYNALTSDTKGNRSVAIGRSALAVQNFTSSTMVYNTAVGYNAGGAVTTGKQSTFLGGLSGDAVSDGTGNTALGYGALSTEQRGNKSTAVGWQALLVANRGSSADSFNTALGYNAGSSVNTGIKNTFIGGGAGSAITSGSNNTILGTFGGNGGGLDIRTSSNNIVLSDGDGNPRGKHNGTTWRWSANAYTTALEYDGNQIYPLADNTTKLGFPSQRWTVVYATTGSINTSDQELKQDIESLSDAELRVATRIKGLIKKFRWKDAVATKGDDARIHVGAIAQEVEQAFTDESLDADRYAIFCKDEWYEVDGKRAESLLEPYTSETENAVKVTRLGLRYDQLLAFVIATL